MRGGDADQHIAQDVLAGHDITTLFATAAKALSRFLPQALRPIRDGLVTAHPAQHGPRGDPQHHGQTMALGTAAGAVLCGMRADGKGTRLNSSHSQIPYAAFYLKNK